MTRLGDRIAALRTEQKLSQADLAERVGTSQSTISQIESGTRNPSYDMIRRIAGSLDLSPSYLIGGDVEGLTDEEEVFFREYRGLSEEARADLRDYLNYLRTTRNKG